MTINWLILIIASGYIVAIVAYVAIQLWLDWRDERWYRREVLKIGDELRKFREMLKFREEAIENPREKRKR